MKKQPRSGGTSLVVTGVPRCRSLVLMSVEDGCRLDEAAIARLGQEDLIVRDRQAIDTTVGRVRGEDCEAWARGVEFWRDHPCC